MGKALRLSNRLKIAAAAVLLVPALAKGTTNELKMELKAVKRLRISTTLLASSTLQKSEQDGRDSFGRILLAPSYSLSEDYRIGASGSLTQRNDQEQKSQIGNTKVTLTRQPIALTNDTQLILIAGGRLPTNPEMRRDDTYNGAVLIDPILMSDWRILGRNFTTTYQLTAAKNFHKYDRNNVGSANISYSFVHYVSVDTEIFRNVIFTLEGDYTYARSYQNTPRSLYSLGQVLTYQRPKWSAAIGHTNSADMFKYDGRESNVALFDKHTSAIYGLVNFVY